MDRIEDWKDLWSFGDPAGSETRLSQRLDAIEDPALRLEVLTWIARAQGLQRRFDDAHATLDQVEADAQSDHPAVAARLLLERGRAFNSGGHPDMARPLFEEATAHCTRHQLDALAVDAAHMVAITATGQEALDWNLKALDMAEASEHDDARKWLGALYNNIGWTLHDLGRYDEALSIFERAVTWRGQMGQDGPWRVARWCVARCLRSMDRLDEALAMQQALRTEHEANGGDVGYNAEELGELLLALGRPDEARPFFAEASLKLGADPWLVANEPQRLARLATLAAD